MESMQGSLIKQSLGIGRRSHHSSLLHALDIPSVHQNLIKGVKSLYGNVMAYGSPTRDLNIHLISLYLAGEHSVPGTLVDRLISMDIPVFSCFQECQNSSIDSPPDDADADGVVDSLKDLLCHEHFLKPYSDEHTLVKLLTRSF